MKRLSLAALLALSAVGGVSANDGLIPRITGQRPNWSDAPSNTTYPRHSGVVPAGGYGSAGCANGNCGTGGGNPHLLRGNHHPALFAPYGSALGHRGPTLPVFQAAPWYLYWPYDAHFMTPAPVFGMYSPPPVGPVGGANPFFPQPAYGMPYGPIR